MPLQPPELSPGDVLGRYELLMPVARGGMGQIWAARLHGTRGFQKLVAIKTILRSHEDEGQLESMLFDEASLASQVRHPNVVETLDLGEREDGTMYLALEWVPGEPLDYILRVAGEHGVPRGVLLNLALQALRGLRAVHEARSASGEPLGIVHRDISLQNLLVSYGGVVKIIDFGIAKATQRMSAPTADGTIKGKFAYMSPEQLRGEALDGRADLFGLGTVLYRATTGTHPFRSDNPAATLHRILMEEPADPCDLVKGYPRGLARVVMRALAKDRDERFASAQEMLAALEHCLPPSERIATDKECEAYVRRLLGHRIVERGETLRAALRAADEGRTVTVAEAAPRVSRSHSTLRAVSIESPKLDVLRASAPPDAGPTASAPVAPLPARAPRAGAIRRLSTLLAVGATCALVAGVAAHRRTPAPSFGVVSSLAVSAAPTVEVSTSALEHLAPPPPVESSLPPPATASSNEGQTVPAASSSGRTAKPPSPRSAAIDHVASSAAAPAQTSTAPAATNAPPLDPLSRRK